MAKKVNTLSLIQMCNLMFIILLSFFLYSQSHCISLILYCCCHKVLKMADINQLPRCSIDEKHVDFELKKVLLTPYEFCRHILS